MFASCHLTNRVMKTLKNTLEIKFSKDTGSQSLHARMVDVAIVLKNISIMKCRPND